MDKPARSLSCGPQEWSCRAIEPLATVGLRCWWRWRSVGRPGRLDNLRRGEPCNLPKSKRVSVRHLRRQDGPMGLGADPSPIDLSCPTA
jgi:hypothetical protein